MSNQELCVLFESLIELLKSDKKDAVIRILENGIMRIDKGATTSSSSEKKDGEN